MRRCLDSLRSSCARDSSAKGMAQFRRELSMAMPCRPVNENTISRRNFETRTKISSTSIDLLAFVGVRSFCSRSLTSGPRCGPMTESPKNKSDRDRNQSARKTQYTIDFCPPTDPQVLEQLVSKHVQQLDRFLTHKPIAKHTKAAFDSLFYANATTDRTQCVPETSSSHQPPLLVSHRTKQCLTDFQRKLYDQQNAIVLDSGCGTGRSSLVLGAKYTEQNHLVLGVDRSMARLSKNPYYEMTSSSESTNTSEMDLTRHDNEEIIVQQVSHNVWLVRAELVDFWRLLLQLQQEVPEVRLAHHYLLYPNPYPKKARVQQRWYGHASFPLLLQLPFEDQTTRKAQTSLVLRSNWKLYLEGWFY